MDSLAMIQRINNAVNVHNSRMRAMAMNNPSGHPKDAEKGRVNHGPDAPTCKRKKGGKCKTVTT